MVNIGTDLWIMDTEAPIFACEGRCVISNALSGIGMPMTKLGGVVPSTRLGLCGSTQAGIWEPLSVQSAINEPNANRRLPADHFRWQFKRELSAMGMSLGHA